MHMFNKVGTCLDLFQSVCYIRTPNNVYHVGGRGECCYRRKKRLLSGSTVADVNPTSKLDDMHQCYAYIRYGEFSFLVLRRASSPARCI